MQDDSANKARIVVNPSGKSYSQGDRMQNDTFLADDGPLSICSVQARATATNKISRDEMNLAEFPLTVLSKRADPSIKTLEFSDYVKGRNGDIINRQWIITGADKFGLPTSSDDEVLLGLLKLTADDGVQSPKVHFTRYELLRVLRWTTEGRSYSRLQNALDRLSGVRIKATNAFYDNETKLHSTRNFGIIDAYEINDGRDTRPSFFTWSEVLFKSFQVGFIKKLDLDFYLDLQSAVSKRLYRYLDKHFWYRSRIQLNLFTLAHEKIGVSRNYVYASSLRQQLEPALEELKDKGILSDFEFSGKGKSTEVILVAAHAPKRTVAASQETSASGAAPHIRPAVHNMDGDRVSIETARVDNTDIRANNQASDDVRAVQAALVERGLAEKQAFRLIAGQGGATLERMRLIIAHFDGLVSQKSPLISKSPTGFLYRAVERPFEFTLPGEKRANQGQKQSQKWAKINLNDPSNQRDLSSRESVRGDFKPRGSTASQQHRGSVGGSCGCDSQEFDKSNLEVKYLTSRSKRLQDVRACTSPEDRERLRNEVEQALAKLRAHISPQRFAEAVEHGVDQRLLDANGFPEFEVWVQKRG